MAVDFNGEVIVNGDGDGSNHCLIPNKESPFLPNVVVSHPYKTTEGQCRDVYGKYGIISNIFETT